MKIVIGADFVPTMQNREFFSNGDVEALLGEELLTVLKSSDYKIFNLEMPLSDQSTPIKKCGPNLSAPTKTITAYQKIKVDLVTLANNHIMDQGIDGFHKTCCTLSDAGINWVGAGNNLTEASKPYFLRSGDTIVGVYACSEHEFSIASNDSCGANPFDPLESLDHISALKDQCDFLVVLYHGGKEYYRYPSPNLQKACRKMVVKGADLVLCQHSHCIGSQEEYHDGLIVYGQGNFLFSDPATDKEYWGTSFLLEADVQKGRKPVYVYHWLKESGAGVRLASQEEAEVISEPYWVRSQQIGDEGFVAEKYQEFARLKISGYHGAFLGRIRNCLLGRAINQLTRRKLWSRFFNEKDNLALRNFIECESHRELIITGLQQLENKRQRK